MIENVDGRFIGIRNTFHFSLLATLFCDQLNSLCKFTHTHIHAYLVDSQYMMLCVGHRITYKSVSIHVYVYNP